MEIEFLSAGFSNWLKTKPRELRAASQRALRRTGSAVASTAIDLFRQRGVGRRIFGTKASGARKIIYRSKLRVRHGVLELPIKLKGLAAIQEKGGVIRQHVIAAKNRKTLAFAWGAKTAFVRVVKKPDSKYPAIPFAARAVAANAGKLREEINIELAKITGKAAA